MFGGSSSSPSKEPDGESSRSTQSSHGAPGASTRPDGVRPTVEVTGGEKRGSSTEMSPGGKSSDDENTGGEKKRRSSSKASALLASAKNSLHLSNSSKAEDEDSHSHSIQKLGRDDPALAVPQGSQNNSAGESVPGPRSTFRVGVTEDRNRKCRRAMEDTHSYLYNFLSTPAPAMGSDGSLKSDQSAEGSSPTTLAGKHPSDAVVETDNGYFAIFDGHAGSFAADWCGKKLHVILEDAIRKNPNTPIPDLLDHTFTLVDQSLEQLPLKNSGCTAVCAVLRWEDRIPSRHSTTGSTAIAPAVAAAVASAAKSNAPESTPSSKSANSTDQTSSSEAAGGGETEQARLQDSAARQRVLYTANVGDARVVLCRGGKALRLSYDHKGSDELEGKRVTNAGGLIINNRVNGVLAVTRALGDSYMKDLVTGHPYTTETIVQPESDEFIILACDGLWDVCTDQEAVDLVRDTPDPQAASKQLVDHALACFTTDNLTVLVVRIDGKALQETFENRTEPIGVEGDPASKKGKLSEADALVLEAQQKVRPSAPASSDNSHHHNEGGGGGGGGKVKPETVIEELSGEPGPELDPEGAKKLPAAVSTSK